MSPPEPPAGPPAGGADAAIGSVAAGRPKRPVRHRRRDRHGRGLRGELAPREVPLARSRGEAFDDLVLDAVEELEGRWARELAEVEFAVEDVPDVRVGADFDPDVVTDRGVPLGRLHRQGVSDVHRHGRAASVADRPVIVVYRRPVEARAIDREDRGDLVFAVVAELVAELLGRDVDEIAPD